jgi:hypothetical protein
MILRHHERGDYVITDKEFKKITAIMQLSGICSQNPMMDFDPFIICLTAGALYDETSYIHRKAGLYQQRHHRHFQLLSISPGAQVP